MYNFENKTFINYPEHEDYDYDYDDSLYSTIPLEHQGWRSSYSSSLYTKNSEFYEEGDPEQINDIIDSYLHNEDDNLIEIVDQLFDIKPIVYEDNEIIYQNNEKHFTLPLTPDQYYMLKEVWNKQLDNEIKKGPRFINSLSELSHLSLTNSDISTGSCPELYTSDISSSHLKSRFYDDDDIEENKNVKNYKKETKKGWRNWFKKSDKIKTNFYETLVKKNLKSKT